MAILNFFLCENTWFQSPKFPKLGKIGPPDFGNVSEFLEFPHNVFGTCYEILCANFQPFFNENSWKRYFPNFFQKAAISVSKSKNGLKFYGKTTKNCEEIEKNQQKCPKVGKNCLKINEFSGY